MTTARALVIVPAHNEARVIERCLDALTNARADLEVVVACNGCTDETATRARRFEGILDLTVLELAASSKPAALNAADAIRDTFPRMYVDADVVVSGRAVLRTAEALQGDDALAARPAIHYDTSEAAGVVRAFYRARERTPALMSALWGAGFYGVSRSGRARWGEFPDGVADDLFVDALFRPHEVAVVASETVTVRPPRTARALLRTLRRVYAPYAAAPPDVRAGEAAAFGSDVRRSGSSAAALIRSNLRPPSSLADAGAYLALALLARAPGTGRAARSGWLRDDTTR